VRQNFDEHNEIDGPIAKTAMMLRPIMNCERCGWPTSVWQRDLVSGLCDRCRHLESTMPGADPQTAVRKALSGHVIGLLNKGESANAIRSTMIANGFDEQTASAAITDATTERELKLAKHEIKPRTIKCPICGTTMTPGQASVQASVTGNVLDVVSVLAGGISAMPQYLYFRPSDGSGAIEINTKSAAQYCFHCATFVIAG
jgi:hypothetical protein